MARVSIPAEHPFAQLKLISLDFGSGSVSIVMKDGSIFVDSVPVSAELGFVTRSTFIPNQSCVEIVAAGSTITMNIGTVSQSPTVPVVYLDQNQWIDFARWRKSGAAVVGNRAKFFEVLHQAALSERVIVPLSSGHLVETSKRGGTSRLDLASTMLLYSRGWQFRAVLALRRAELRSIFGAPEVTIRDCVTLDPRAILDMDSNTNLGQELGLELSGLVERLVWAGTVVSILLDERPERSVGQAFAAHWAQSFRPLALEMRDNRKARARSRDVTRMRFLTDLGSDLPAAAKESGLSPEQFAIWLETEAEDAIAATPGLGRLREVMHLRLSNSDEKWEGNDLIDWMHLSYAAGYCDLVLGERKTINYLRRTVDRVRGGAILHHRSEDALGALEALLDSP